MNDASIIGIGIGIYIYIYVYTYMNSRTWMNDASIIWSQASTPEGKATKET